MKIDIKNKNEEIIKDLLGSDDGNLSIIKEYYNVGINYFKGEISINCDDEKINKAIIDIVNILIMLLENKVLIKKRDVSFVIDAYEKGKKDEIVELYLNNETIIKTKTGLLIKPKSFNQKRYADEIKKQSLVFGIGPAGTGKTFLAVAWAVKMLKDGNIKKIILTRPAVEAGESLGFLPGDLKEKVDPYLRPLYDALYDLLGKDLTDSYIKSGILEIAPLAYMRGRTLERAFVILDEAQNTTYSQMKMFLTRMGYNSKMVVTGDISQIDLPKGVTSGLKEALKILQDEKDIKFCYFDKIDVIRHPLVKKIIARYEKYENKSNK